MTLLPLTSLLKVIVCLASVTLAYGDPTSTYQLKKLRDTYDFIIVGGGTAGCVLANRLSENPDWQVLLLEAGDEEIIDYTIPAVPTHSLSRIKWGYNTEPDENSCLSMPGGVCEVPTARVLGGSSVLNDMKYLRGSRFDYDEWADKGCRGWNYASLLEFFKKSEDNGNNGIAINSLYHARGGHLHVETFKHSDKNVGRLISAFYEIGFNNVDLNSNVREGVMRAQFTQRNNTRLSTNEAFLNPVRNRGNLQILTSAFVTKLIINEDHRIAEGLTFEYYTKKYVVKANMEIVISAGPINSAKILLLSGIGPKEHLNELGINIIKELPVGENYQDQITMNGIALKIDEMFAVNADDEEISRHFKTWFHNRTGPIGSMGVSQCSAFVKLYEEERVLAPDIEFIFEGNHLRNNKFLLSNLTVLEVHSQNKPYPFYNTIILKPVVLKPYSKGYVRLNKENPLRNKPHIHAKLLSRNEDLKYLVDSIEFIRRFLKTHDMKHIGAELMSLDYAPCNSNQTDELWKCVARHYTKPMGRPIGTCKMGSDDDGTSVVNIALRVHDIDGLRVIDSSIMPTHVRGNIYSTTVMIAEKGAKIIKDYWKNDDNEIYHL